jgi:GR25 family glycosyltransferase involved in LPS biosynthesis
MHSLYDIPVYYIGFTKKPELEKMLRSVGFKNINHFQAIDGRDMDPKSLCKKKTISFRAYTDLIDKPSDMSGLASTGAVGCTLSHIELWKKCAEQFDSILIAEDDLILHSLAKEDEENILAALAEPNGAFISPHFSNEIKRGEIFWGTHLCFISKSAAKKLLNNALPIEVQLDSYISHMNNLNEINVTGYAIARQSLHISSIQDICFKCLMPKSLTVYVVIFIALIAIVVILMISVRFLYKCRKSKV